jgi:hypothetical protein
MEKLQEEKQAFQLTKRVLFSCFFFLDPSYFQTS